MSDIDEIRKLRKLCSDLRRVHQENEERYGNAAEALMQLVESKDAEIERLNGLLGWHDTTVPEILRLRRINEDHCKAVNTLTVENSRQADEIERLTGLFDKWHTIAAEQKNEIERLKAAIATYIAVAEKQGKEIERLRKHIAAKQPVSKQLSADGFLGDEWDEEIPG